MFGFLNRQTLVCVSICLFSLIVFSEAGQAETAIIQVQYRWASETLPVINHFLSASGVATVDERTNSLIIIDTVDVIDNIKKFLQNFDAPVKRVRIRVRFNERQSSQDRHLSVEGGISGKNWHVDAGKKNKDGIDVRIGDSNRSNRQSNEYMIQTTSGSTAYILTGKAVQFRERWGPYCRRYATHSDTVSFQKIDTGLEIKALIVGDHATVEITPRISHVDADDQKGIIRFSAVSTQISVPLGKWVTIGGTGNNSDEVLQEILGGGSRNQNSTLSMSVLIETY